MKLSNYQYELIAAYIRNELSGAALKEFESELASNELFRKELDFEQAITTTFHWDKVKETLKQAKTTHLLKEKSVKRVMAQDSLQRAKTSYYHKVQKRKWIVAILAAACVLLVGLLGLRTGLPAEVNEQMILIGVQLSPKESGDTKVSGRQSVIIKKLKDAEAAYNNNELEKTINYFNVLREKPYKYNSPEMSLYEGIILARQGDYLSSIKMLNELIDEKTEIENDVHWHLGWIHLKFNKKQDAKMHFEILSNTSDKYRNSAIKTLKKHFRSW